jgi:hypothetical protein
MAVHEVAEEGFGKEAATYERVRPSYPSDAVGWLAGNLELRPGRTVIDVAAGTGKFTRLLVPFSATVVAAEPVEGMRRSFVAVVPGVPIVAAVAEACRSRRNRPTRSRSRRRSTGSTPTAPSRNSGACFDRAGGWA